MLRIISLDKILLVLAFVLPVLATFFPIHHFLAKVLSKISGFSLSHNLFQKVLIFGLPLALLLLVALRQGTTGIILLVVSIFNLWAFLFAFNSHRSYSYILSMVFLAFTPFLVLLGFSYIAEFSAILCYLALVVGVSKDIFYEKFFKE